MKRWIVNTTLIAIFPAIIVMMFLLFSFFDYRLNARDIDRKMDEMDIVESVQNLDVRFYVIRPGEEGHFYWYGVRFETEYQMVVFSRSVMLPRFRLLSHWPLSPQQYRGNMAMLVGGWHSYSVDVIESPAGSYLEISRLGLRPLRTIAVPLAIALMLITFYAYILRQVKSTQNKRSSKG